MNYDLPKIELSEPAKIWMGRIYSKLKNKENINYRILKTELLGKIPNNFDPKNIDNRLLIGKDRLSLLGIWHVDPNSDLIPKADKIIRYIWNSLLKNKEMKRLNSEDISNGTKINEKDIGLIFKLIGQLGHFWSSATVGSDDMFTDITIDSDVAFDEYLKYPGIEELIENFYNKYQIVNSSEKDLHPLINKEIYENKIKPIFRTKISQIDPNLCFVLMPFSEEWSNRVYRELIRENVEKLGLQCLRADNLMGQIIIEDIWTKIIQCAFIIADITAVNPNVMYELGIVHVIGKPAILITQDIHNIPFDFTHLRHYEYKDNSEGFRNFSEKLPTIIREIYREFYNRDLNII